MPRIVLIGDLAPTGCAAHAYLKVDIEKSDMILGNLETPLSSGLGPHPKAGPVLLGNAEPLAQLAAYPTLLSLANNHIMDYGEAGLAETVAICGTLGIDTVGAGSDLDAALSPVIKDVGGVKVGVLACAETQFGISTPWQAGVASILYGKMEAAIRNLASEVDIVIVTVHGAAELCPWPSPHWQNILRGFIDAGALIVHGHHSHVPQGYESYHGGIIFYGLGNFLVDPERWKGHTNVLWSVMAKVKISGSGIGGLEINTVSIEAGEHPLVSNAQGTEIESHKAYLADANNPLDDCRLLTSLWQEVSIRMYTLWHAKMLGFGPGVPRVNAKGIGYGFLAHARELFRRVRSATGGSARNNKLLCWYHLFSCETHRDSIATALGVLSGELEDMRTDETRDLADKMMPWSR